MKNDLKLFIAVLINLAYVFILTWIASLIFSVSFVDALLPIVIAVVVSKIVQIRFELNQLSDVKSKQDELDKKINGVRDSVKFESNMRVIGDNLTKIDNGWADIKLRELQHEVDDVRKRFDR